MEIENRESEAADDLQFNIQMESSQLENLSKKGGAEVSKNLNISRLSTRSDVTIEPQEMKKGFSLRNSLPKFLQNASHPGVCLLTFGFKVAALASYLLLNLFVKNLVLVYIVVIVLQAIDFYVVKNITGRYVSKRLYIFRLLVGLRWSTFVTEQGKEEWIFESVEESNLTSFSYLG